MARANLGIDLGVTEAFLAAQDAASSTRLLRVGVAGEQLVLRSLGTRTGTAEIDFATVLASSVSDTEAALLLFSLTESGSGSANNVWAFVAWVPDSCQVREKMLMSASREDLKKTLGQGYFVHEYSANSRSDLTWRAFQESRNKERSADMLSERERSVFEERLASHAESNATKSSAMNVLPFAVAPELRAGLGEFKVAAGATTTNWVAMTVAGETVTLVSSKTVGDLSSPAGGSLQSHVSETEAQFILIRQTSKSGSHVSFFVFSCPEAVPIRSKMVMSSAKATVLAIIAEAGIAVDFNKEIRSSVDIDDTLKSELGESSAAATSASSASAALAHNKPTRPGQKGRSTKPVAKFVAEEET